MIKTELVTIEDANNLVIELVENYSENTVVCFKIDGNSETELTITELGENFIQIPQVTLNSILKINYVPKSEIPLDTLHTELRSLKEKVNFLLEENEKLTKAIDNRVSITTFQSWITLIEDKLGIRLDTNLLPLYSTTKLFKK